MFAVVYRWKLKPGTEESFRDAWKTATEAIAHRSGTGGSRLHRADDGTFVAYAIWPSRKAWEDARALPSAAPEAGTTMRECIEQSLETLPLEVLDDRWRPLP
jgi:heme-degrading monooxygenase HmoA